MFGIDVKKMGNKELSEQLRLDAVSKRSEGRYDAARIMKEASERLGVK